MSWLEDAARIGIPSEYRFTRAEIEAMPIISTNPSTNWVRRDCGKPDVKVETFTKSDGHFTVSIMHNNAYDGSGSWTPYGTYPTNEV